MNDDVNRPLSPEGISEVERQLGVSIQDTSPGCNPTGGQQFEIHVVEGGQSVSIGTVSASEMYFTKEELIVKIGHLGSLPQHALRGIAQEHDVSLLALDPRERGLHQQFLVFRGNSNMGTITSRERVFSAPELVDMICALFDDHHRTPDQLRMSRERNGKP